MLSLLYKLNLKNSKIDPYDNILIRSIDTLSMQTPKDCTCNISNQSSACSSSLHTMAPMTAMESESKTKPRLFHQPTMSEEPEEVSSGDEDPYKFYAPQRLRIRKEEAISKMKRGLIEDTGMMEQNRNSLNKFESLSLQGNTLTGISIGGFDIDLSKAAEKTMEIVPLPPSKLPIIFADETLNFYHHFFQGMVLKIGQSAVDFIARSDHHYDDDEEILMPLLEDMIASGYEKSDTESTLLIKKVLGSTFEPVEHRQRGDKGPRLKVVTNLWGFQYIECGMQMAEVDLKMWFSICYSHYRTIWFNTFKTTGTPSFASQGIRKTRSSSSSASTMPALMEEHHLLEYEIGSTMSKSGRKRRGPSKSIRSSKKQAEDNSSYQIARWLGGKN